MMIYKISFKDNNSKTYSFFSYNFLSSTFMNKILNHDTNVPSRESQDNHKQYPNQSQVIYNPNNNQNNKHSIQQLYKNQLDIFLSQKQRQKKLQKERIDRQKEEYRQNAKIGQENEKMKNIAYKNYYKMLMQGQNLHNETYISPYEQRDKLKDSFINVSIQSQQKNAQNWQYQLRRREIQKRNQYKDELMKQIQQRKRVQIIKKQQKQQQNSYIRQYNQLNQEIQTYDREKKKQGMDSYKHELDRLVVDKLSQSRKNTQTDPQIKFNDEYHNPLTNPLPYNIQNPYILRQLQKSRSTNIKAQTPGLQEYNNYDRERGRGQQQQQNYFARQGYDLLK